MRQLVRVAGITALLLTACSEEAAAPAPPDAEDGMVLEGDAYRIAAPYRLPQQCEGGAIPRWNGSTWSCSTEPIGALACAAGQIAKWDGAHWNCAADEAPAYAAGAGLELEAGTFTLADGFRVPQGCPVASIPRWDGSAWQCGADLDTGTITGVTPGAGLVGGGTQGVATVALDTGFTDARYAPRLQATTDVPATNDSVANGAALRAAVAAIPAKSSATPWLLRLEPGDYFLGDQALLLPEFVNLQGAGSNVTRVVGTGADVIVLAGSNDVRDLFVLMVDENTTAGIRTTGSEVRIRDVRLQGMAPGTTRSGVRAQGSLTLDNVHVEIFNQQDAAYAVRTEGGMLRIRGGLLAAGNSAFSYGVYAAGPLEIDGTEISVGANGGASTAVETVGASADIRGSTLESMGAPGIGVTGFATIESSRITATTVVLGDPAVGAVRVAGTRLGGPVSALATCVASYDASFRPLGPNCR